MDWRGVEDLVSEEASSFVDVGTAAAADPRHPTVPRSGVVVSWWPFLDTLPVQLERRAAMKVRVRVEVRC